MIKAPTINYLFLQFCTNNLAIYLISFNIHCEIKFIQWSGFRVNCRYMWSSIDTSQGSVQQCQPMCAGTTGVGNKKDIVLLGLDV